MVNVIVYSSVSSGTSEGARAPMLRAYLDSLLDINSCVFPAFCIFVCICAFASMLRVYSGLYSGHQFVLISQFLYLLLPLCVSLANDLMVLCENICLLIVISSGGW